MRKLVSAILVGLLLVGIVGCGKEAKIEVTTLTVNKDGSIVGTIIEDFGKPYYNLDELKKMISDEVTEYNAKDEEDSVTLKSVEATGSNVTVIMNYKDSDDYTGMNQKAFFTGTVEDAYDAGYDLDVSLKSVSDETEISKTELLEMSDKHIVIVREPLNIQTFGKILYISDGVKIAENSKVATVTGDDFSYIVFK